jgi:hypothetical protein
MFGIAVTCFVWAGMVLGIPFLETPVKFTAPSVALAIGLDVGKHVFRAFNRVEIAGSLICIAIAWAIRPAGLVWAPIGAIAGIVALQTAWLLPVMNRRIESILDGRPPAPAPFHRIYVALEVLKLICLIAAGILALGALQRAQ